MTELLTDLSVAPYFDDFNEDKKFVKILIKPSYAVQAREVNQIQTILQNQISRFGNHVFKDGSVVDGVAITYNSAHDFVHLKNTFANNTLAAIETLPTDGVIVNQFGVRAVADIVKRGFEAQYPATNRVYLKYIKTGKDLANNDVTAFASGETLTIYNSNQSKFGALDANNIFDTINVITGNSTVNAIGTAYSVKISDGTIFQKGYFSKVSPQLTLVKEYDTNTTNMAVGFQTVESIITVDQDASLYDNANGTTNTLAPGADRLKLEPILVAVDKTTLDADSNFFPIAEFNDNEPVEQNIDPVYNTLGAQIAKRTGEESGNFVVKPFTVESLVNANSALMDYQVSPGIGYVNGYRVELIGSKKIAVDRATTTAEANAQIVTGNYGSYILVNQAVGIFDINNIGTVTFYDAAQTTITDIEAASAAPTGNVVGTANIRGFVFNSGTKGLPTAQFRAYIFNIKMNSGKVFDTDAKSIYMSSSYGFAKADLVLENSRAVLKDPSKDTLVFKFGLDSIRRLTNKAGVNDTQFVFRDTVSTTLQANGLATFTLNTPYAGGSERLNASVGTLSDAAENGFDVVLSALAYSANQAGTVSVTGTTVTGVGTSFLTTMAVDKFVRFPSTGDIRRVTAIANNLSMTINSTSVANTVGYQKAWPEGSIINTAGANGSVSVISNTQFSVSTEVVTTGGSGTQLVYANYQVLRTNAVAIKKEIKKGRFVKIDCTANTGGPWNLGLVDINKLTAVYVGNTYSESNPDRKAWFSLDNGQTDSVYGHGSLVINPAYKSQITAATRILVKLDHFQANTTAGAGFFSVDSYPFVDAGQTANSTNISIGEVPLYKTNDVRGLIDFRPQRFSTANSTTDANTATVNPAAANTSFNNVSTGSYIIEPDSNFEADIEYYMPRYDMLTITKDGELHVNFGNPSLNPIKPTSDADTMDVAEIYVPAYPSLTTRESQGYLRSDLGSTVSLVTHRNYTKRDIGGLDDRITRLEYYVTLNALEQSAKDLTVTDAAGLNRFKNGIFADPFNSHAFGDVGNFEYKIAVDSDNSVIRPFIKRNSVDYIYSNTNSTGVQVTGSKITLPYTSVVYAQQTYASKYRTCTESVWKWNGEVNLYPEYDHFVDETKLPASNVTVDLASAWEQFANSPFGSSFGDWRTSVASSSTTSSSTSGRSTTTTTATTTATTSSRSVTSLNVGVTTSTYSFGSYVTDVSMSPYMRSREVAFVATGLKPSTKVFAFFDDVAVSSSTAQGVLSGKTTFLEGAENGVVNRTKAYGSQLETDANGVCIGMFKIPEGQFRTGDRKFTLCDVSDLVTGNSAILTTASAIYTASSLAITTQEATLTTRTPTITASSYTQTNTVVDTTVNTNTVTRPVTPNRTNSGNNSNGGRGGAASGDPIAQSFLVTAPTSSTGVFVNKLGVYFQSKDATLGVTAYIVEMYNGYPNTSKVVAKKHLSASEVSVSANASVETIFDFNDLVCLTKDSMYAFMIKPDGDSPDYRIWTSELGGVDISTQQQIFSNPYVGTLFISANAQTWTTIQTEDMKFNLYRADFTASVGTAAFLNEDDDYFTVDALTKANSSLAVQVGDIVRTANSTGGLLTSNTDPVGWVQALDEATNTLIIDTSSGNFVANTPIQIHREYMNGANTLNANTLIASSRIASIDNLQYSVIVPRFSFIKPSGTNLAFAHKGYDLSYTVDAGFSEVTPETDNEKTDEMRMVVSRSNEVTNLAGAKSSRYNITFTSNDSYVSPVVDMLRKSSLVIKNLINNDSTNEDTRYGNALSRYLSAQITLADGQDAEDILVYISAYRPVGTNVEVYAKFLNGNDNEAFTSKVWTKLTNNSAALYSSSTDKSDMREFAFAIPTSVGVTSSAYKNLSNSGIVQYARGDGALFQGYKSFAIKIVPLSDNQAQIPLVDDVRAICLQV